MSALPQGTDTGQEASSCQTLPAAKLTAAPDQATLKKRLLGLWGCR